MNKEKRQDYLIVVSAILSVLAFKIADMIFPVSIDLSFINDQTVETIVGFIIKLTIIVILTYLLLPLIKWLAKKTVLES